MLNTKQIRAFEKIIGADNVIVNKKDISNAETATYPTDQSIEAILKPSSSKEIQECVLLANEIKIPIYTISTGKNWGYGSRVPVKNGCIQIDLTRMNKIIDFDENLAYVTIEPGVTVQQLFDFLRDHNSKLLIGIGGSSPNASLIGNTMERGLGGGPNGDRYTNSCGMEIVLPNGEIIRTGFKRYSNSKTINLHQRSSGPHIDGLFSQSNFGIVTQMTFWLMPCPQYAKMIYFTLKDNGKLVQMTNSLRDLFMQDLIRPTISIFNEYRIITSSFQYPKYDKKLNKLNNSEIANELIKQINNELQVGPWNGDFAIYGADKELVNKKFELIISKIKNIIDKFSTIEFSQKEILNTLNQSNTSLENKTLTEKFLTIKYLGIPTKMGLKQAYWKKSKSNFSFDNPDKDKCGILWIAPVIPFIGENIQEAVSLIMKITDKYHFQCPISLLSLQPRSIYIFAAIIWDREIDKEENLAIKCYHEIIDNLEKKGYYSYRSSTLLMNKQENKKDSYFEFINSLKNSIDPNNIISPGRYNIDND